MSPEKMVMMANQIATFACGNIALALTEAEDYLINAIMNPDKERPKSFKDAAMPPLGIKKKEAKALVEYIKSLK